jgi:colanic acid biosynthesis glycosyl transferase WcaI
MKILFFSLCYKPEKTGIAVTSTELCQWLAAQGHKVTVICGFPFYPEWKTHQGYESKLFMSEQIDSVNLKRCWVYVPKKINTLTRILHEFSFMISAFLRAVFLPKPDIVICTTPPLTLGLAGLFISRLKRTKAIINVQDLQPDAAVELGMLKNTLVIKLMYILEKFLYKSYDGISSLGKGMLNRIKNKGLPEAKLIFLPNTAEPELLNLRRRTDKNPLREIHNLDHEFIALHSGNMGVKQGIDVILESAKLAPDDSIRFMIVGDGAQKQRLMDKKSSLGLSNVTFLPLQSRENFPYMLAAADIFLLTQLKEVVDIVVPSKLISAMARGSCIVASVHPASEAAQIVAQSNCGTVVEPENPAKLTKAIEYYRNNPKKIRQCKINSRKYAAKHFDRQKTFADFENKLFQIAEKQAGNIKYGFDTLRIF